MIINKISIANFRSYGATAQIIAPQPGLNVVVGENNTGKSSIWAAIQRATLHGELDLNDRPWGISANSSRIEVTASFSTKESESLYGQLFGDELAEIERRDNLRPTDALERLLKMKYCSSMTLRSWSTTLLGGQSLDGPLLEFGTSTPQHSVRDILRTMISERQDPEVFLINLRGSIRFNANISQTLDSLFRSRIKAFADVRPRPQGVGGGGAGTEESFSGNSTADLLMNLKNGSIPKRAKFRRIQERFARFFPSLSLEVIGAQGGQPSIVFNRDGHAFDIPPEQTGTGVFEILTILANLEGRSEYVLFIEEPGTHLHPHGQRALQRLILESSPANQIFVLSHSPESVNWADLKGVTRVWTRDAATQLSNFPTTMGPNEEAALYSALRDPQKREMLFARVVFLVEGDTEQGFFTAMAPRLGVNLDALGVSVVSVDGQDQYMPFIRLLSGMNIPFICQRDIGPGGSSSELQQHFRFSGGEFESVITSAGAEALLVAPEAGRSKARRGRYVGVNIEIARVPEVYRGNLMELQTMAQRA